MTEVAGGQNEANKTFLMEYFFKPTLFSNQYSYDQKNCRICTIEDGDYSGEVELRLTPRLRSEMRLTVIFQYILSRLTLLKPIQ